ncbi:MAG: hypothetical protein AB8B56_18815 [Crocinitomicaceae bacterium]
MKTLKICALALTNVLLAGSSFGQVGFNGTNPSGANATALGSLTTASGSAATSLGWRSTASGTQSLAAGHWSTASGLYSFALGARAVASNSHAMAFGVDARATANRSFVIGTGTANSTAGSIINSTSNSLMVGFNSTIPSLFVGPSAGPGTIGNVGVGTANPQALLDVRGVANNPNMRLTNSSGQYLDFGVSDCNGCFSASATPGDAVMRVLGGGDLLFSIPGTNGSRQIGFDTGGGRVMTVQEVGTTGKVGIGTTNFPTSIGGANISGYHLFVQGGVLADEVRVRTGWADYVFYDDYELKPLSEVADYIEENGHLPNVPSAEQVEEEGIELGDITKIQQEKIEELTLYVIKLQEQLDELQKQYEKMEK